MKTILIIGGNFINKGAESMLMATVSGIRKNFPGFEPVLIDLFPVKTASEKTEYDFRIVNMHVRTLFRISFPFLKLVFRRNRLSEDEKEIKSLFAEASALFDISGYGLSAHNQPLLWSVAYLLPFRLARKSGVPVWLLPQSFGPFNFKGVKKLLFKIWGQSLLNYPELAFAREPEGFEDLQAVREKPCLLSPDIVLQRDLNVELQSGDEVIVIPNRQLFNFSEPDKVVRFFSDIIQRFLEKELVVRIVRHSRDDEELCRSISGLISHNSLIVDSSDYSIKALIEQISKARFVVSARYHGAVHALICHKPILIIGWAGKYRYLAQLFGISNQLIDLQHRRIEDINIPAYVDGLVSEKDNLTECISTRLKEIRHNSFWNHINLKS
jgi:polysaccharide pyruvyl transferase WcaK-like protein